MFRFGGRTSWLAGSSTLSRRSKGLVSRATHFSEQAKRITRHLERLREMGDAAPPDRSRRARARCFETHKPV
jgi:hypothetical protein